MGTISICGNRSAASEKGTADLELAFQIESKQSHVNFETICFKIFDIIEVHRFDPGMSTAIREALGRHLREKQKRNPGYSLREFSKQLDVSPATLSQILKGKRVISKKTLQKALKNIHLDAADTKLIYSAIKHSQAEMVPMDQFHVIVDWYYFAILSLAETIDFDSRPSWVARRLNITVKQAQDALKRLQRLQMLATDDAGVLRPTNKSFHSSDGVMNLLIQKRHRQHLSLAEESLQQDSVDERDFTAVTMAIDPTKLVAAKKMIRKFRDRLCQFLESGNRTEVFIYCQQLYPLTKNRDGKRGDSE